MQPGQRVGKYVLGERIARGGMAEVWAAHVEGPGGFRKPLALKFILESFAGDSELERLFLNEARLAAQLQHANLVAVFDFDKVSDGPAGEGGPAPDRYYIAMERIEGHDLRRVVRAAAERGRRIPPSLSLYVAGEVLKGLRHVHERRDERGGGGPLGLVHRDVSPHNVLVSFDGEVKLSDFGIAKAMAAAHSQGTGAGMVRGKLAYASPEQLRSAPVDHRSDQFSLGVVLWELLAARRLFDGADAAEIMGKVLRCQVPPLERSAAVDAAVEAVARRMLAPAAADRFPSTAAALAAVRGAPGYAGDAAGIIELMRDLFAPAAAGAPLPPTLELDGKQAPTAAIATAETQSLSSAQVGAAAAAAAGAPAEAPVAVAPVGAGVAAPAPPAAATAGATGATGALATGSAEASFFRRATEGSGSSAYATTLSSDAADAPPARPRSRLPWALGLGALTGGIALGAWALVLRGPPGAGEDDGQPPRAAVATPAASAPVVVPSPPAVPAPPATSPLGADDLLPPSAVDAATSDAAPVDAAESGHRAGAARTAAVTDSAGTGGAPATALPAPPASGSTRARSAANGAPLLE